MARGDIAFSDGASASDTAAVDFFVVFVVLDFAFAAGAFFLGVALGFGSVVLADVEADVIVAPIDELAAERDVTVLAVLVDGVFFVSVAVPEESDVDAAFFLACALRARALFLVDFDKTRSSALNRAWLNPERVDRTPPNTSRTIGRIVVRVEYVLA